MQSGPVGDRIGERHQGWMGEEDHSHDMKSTLFLCTCPASKVSRATFFGGSPEVVRHDYHEPLSCELVAPLPCPGHHHHYHAIVHGHDELSLSPKDNLVELPSPAPIEALNVIVPDDTRTAVRLPHCVNLQVRPKVHDLDTFLVCLLFLSFAWAHLSLLLVG